MQVEPYIVHQAAGSPDKLDAAQLMKDEVVIKKHLEQGVQRHMAPSSMCLMSRKHNSASSQSVQAQLQLAVCLCRRDEPYFVHWSASGL